MAFGYLVQATGGNYSRAILPLAVMTAVAAVIAAGIDPTRPFAGEPSASWPEASGKAPVVP